MDYCFDELNDDYICIEDTSLEDIMIEDSNSVGLRFNEKSPKALDHP